MKLKEYKEKKMTDYEFVASYAEIQSEMNSIRAAIKEKTSQKPTLKNNNSNSKQ